MPAMSEMLKTTEAAVIAEVSLRDVNRVIDERILSDSLVSQDDGRQISASACSLIAFYFESAKRLTSEQRRSAMRFAETRLQIAGPAGELPKVDWTFREDFLTIDFQPFVTRALARLTRLDEARRVVTASADILGGTPIIRGTRIPVHDIASALATGISEDELLEDYPSLNRKKLALAAFYAEANPWRGRPRPLLARLPAGTRKISERRIKRISTS
jgi:uncharacterized protein (DUF433 family)